MTRAYTIEFDREEDGRWIAEVEEVPGAMAYGATPAEAAGRAVEIAVAADPPRGDEP